MTISVELIEICYYVTSKSLARALMGVIRAKQSAMTTSDLILNCVVEEQAQKNSKASNNHNYLTCGLRSGELAYIASIKN